MKAIATFRWEGVSGWRKVWRPAFFGNNAKVLDGRAVDKSKSYEINQSGRELSFWQRIIRIRVLLYKFVKRGGLSWDNATPFVVFLRSEQEMMWFKIFLDLKSWRSRIILYLCARFRFSKTDNFFSDRIEKVSQNGQLCLRESVWNSRTISLK